MPQSQIITAGNAVNRSAPLNRGLGGWWLNLPNRQGGGGNTFRDLLNRNHGTLVNGPTWQGAKGRPGGFGSLSFDGTDDYCQLPADLSFLHGIPAATLSMWVKLRTATPASESKTGLCNTRANAAGTASHYPYTDGVGYLATFRSSRVNSITLSSAVVRTQWHMVTVTTDGTDWKLYQNNILVRTQAAEATVNWSAADAFLGRSYGSSTFYYLDGWLDDIQIYTRALSAADVSHRFHRSCQGYPNELNWIRSRRYSVVEEGGGDTGIAHRLLLLGVG